ncbi:DUF732 domain-containing protein [Amycolatopsis sp. NPDC051373]|uniref:DUF732 domain-containing protein n=1 Tax=Amycolatopsis sp. NPDC051373 TaxID=3155801 RepID=UPI00344CA819
MRSDNRRLAAWVAGIVAGSAALALGIVFAVNAVTGGSREAYAQLDHPDYTGFMNASAQAEGNTPNVARSDPNSDIAMSTKLADTICSHLRTGESKADLVVKIADGGDFTPDTAEKVVGAAVQYVCPA